MHDNDSGFEKLMRDMAREQAPDSLLSRITAVVPHLPQERHIEKSGVLVTLLRFTTEWRYGLAIKAPTFACIAAAGVMMGQPSGGEADILGSILFGGIAWESFI